MLQKCYGCLAPETKKKQRRNKEEQRRTKKKQRRNRPFENKQKILLNNKFEITGVEF